MGTLKVSGIYAIINTLNNKVYVGKSINIKYRWWQHKNDIKNNSKNCNRYLKASVNKYGIENFKIDILEEISIDKGDNYFKERELFWMDYLNTCNRENGYNLRRDSSTKMFVHLETRILKSKANTGNKNPNYGNNWSDEAKLNMSKLKKRQYANGEVEINMEGVIKGIINRNKKWEDNPELKLLMSKRVSDKKSKYNFLKIDPISFEIIERFSTFMEIKEKYPDIGKTVIFSVCNGNKKSYRGYLWRYQDKITLEIIDPR